MTTAPRTPPAEELPTTGRLMLRLAVGCASLADGELRTQLSDWHRVGSARPAETPSMSSRLHRAVGLCIRARHHARVATSRARAAWGSRAARLAPILVALDRSSLGRRARALAARAREELALAEALGRLEEIEGRELARQAVEGVTGRAFGRLVDDPEIRSLVAEQSATLTSTAVDELRSAVADADARVESTLHRWLEGPRARLAAARAGSPRRA